jgi:hypothetical protein
MKFVSLMITGLFITFSAAAQTTDSSTAKKTTVANVQPPAKGKKAKAARAKAAADTTITTLVDVRTYKAKWSFEQMLQRRLEIDAEEGERVQQKK